MSTTRIVRHPQVAKLKARAKANLAREMGGEAEDEGGTPPTQQWPPAAAEEQKDDGDTDTETEGGGGSGDEDEDEDEDEGEGEDEDGDGDGDGDQEEEEEAQQDGVAEWRPAPNSCFACGLPGHWATACDARRVYLNNGFHQNEQVKARGAKYDGRKKRWWIAAGHPTSPRCGRGCSEKSATVQYSNSNSPPARQCAGFVLCIPFQSVRMRWTSNGR